MNESAACWYVDVCAVESRVAKLIGGRLIALKLVPHVMPALARAQVGDVYLARIAKAAHGMRAMFVDLGDGGEGLLRTRESHAEGELVVARVIQSAYGSKRAVLKREANAEEMSERQPRRISQPLSAEQYLDLAAHWREGDALFVDSDHPWRGPAAISATPGLFEREGIEAQIEAALEAVVPLPGGARLFIEQTQALVAIDVDVGAEARASEANTQAAREIPYQIAARGLAGNIVVDFAQIGSAGALAAFKERMAAAAQDIGIDLQIGMGSRTGLLELQRRRTEPPLAALLTEAGLTHGAVPPRLSLEAGAARLARAVRVAATRLPGALDLHIGAALADWLVRGEGQAAWQAIRAASPAPLHLVAGGVDDGLFIERRERSAP